MNDLFFLFGVFWCRFSIRSVNVYGCVKLCCWRISLLASFVLGGFLCVIFFLVSHLIANGDFQIELFVIFCVCFG